MITNTTAKKEKNIPSENKKCLGMVGKSVLSYEIFMLMERSPDYFSIECKYETK